MTDKIKNKSKENQQASKTQIPHVLKRGMDNETIRQIEKLSGLGLTQKQIAYVLNMKPTKFQWWLENDELVREAIDSGVAKLNAQVAQTAFKLAVSGDCPAATFFWLKTRMGWREVNHVDVSVRPDVVYRSTVRADGSLIQEVLEGGRVIDAEAEGK